MWFDAAKESSDEIGIPNADVADTARHFHRKEFEQFAKEWDFECSSSDLYHSQLIGKAESAVKIAKKLI